MVIIEAFRYYDTKEFLGLKQISGNIGEQNFHRNGILNYVRHLIYSGTVLLVLGYFLFSPTLLNMVTVSCMILYILIGLRLEEHKLIKAFGADYIRYLKEVPGLIPRGKRKL
jgi:protein-S-isoprenylcysteine O-methyltransferase Ste14